MSDFMFFFFFFFQAEDGIRDKLVTGVQTCALPIYRPGGCRGGDGAGPLCAHREPRGRPAVRRPVERSPRNGEQRPRHAFRGRRVREKSSNVRGAPEAHMCCSSSTSYVRPHRLHSTFESPIRNGRRYCWAGRIPWLPISPLTCTQNETKAIR